MDWFHAVTPLDVVQSLGILFGLAALDKARDEFRTVYVADRLTHATDRTTLGWAYRNKSLTLGWLMVAIGLVACTRNIPRWDEPAWLAIVLYACVFAALAWNRRWRKRAMAALEERLEHALSGVPVPPEEHQEVSAP